MATHSPIRARATGLTGRRSEAAVLDGLIDAVRAGESRALVVRGEPGAGKTALLEYLAGRAAPDCRVARAAGVQSEMELAFAALQQLCAPMLDHVDHLPVPQGDALRTALGLSAGSRVRLGLRCRRADQVVLVWCPGQPREVEVFLVGWVLGVGWPASCDGSGSRELPGIISGQAEELAGHRFETACGIPERGLLPAVDGDRVGHAAGCRDGDRARLPAGGREPQRDAGQRRRA